MSDETSAPADVNPGDRIAGYRLEEQIGQGGMAVVYRALDERLNRRVALKLLAPGLAADNAFRTRFIRESRAAAAVDHPNIIPVYDAGDAGGFLFIAMRYVQGGDVRSLFSDGQQLSPARAWNIISQVAAALDAAHAHDLIHRDVKPANILLDAGGRTSGSKTGGYDDAADHVYLSDFGISKQTLASHLTSTGQFVGTLDYIAPEQIEARTVDGRADQYSLACATFELLTGEPPYRRDLGLALINAHLSAKPPSLLARRPDLPPAAEQVLHRAMAKWPAQRYASCTEFATNLGRAFRLVPGVPDVGGQAHVQAAPASPEQAKPWPAADPAAGGAVAAAAAITAAPVGAVEGWGGAGAGASPPASPQVPTTAQGVPPPHAETPGAFAQRTMRSGWPGDPGWQQRQPKRRSGRTAGIVAAVLAVLVLGAGGAYAYVHFHKTVSGSSEGNSLSSSKTAKAQAAALNTLLGTSVQTHSTLQNAVLDIENNCSSLSTSQIANDVTAIRAADKQRQTEYTNAQSLSLGELANASTLKTDLMHALYYSLQADNNFLTWSQQEQNGCFVSSQSSAYQAASRDSTTASADKTAFANVWNTEASKYRQQPIVPGNI